MHVALSTRCSVTLRLDSSCGSPISKLPRKIYELMYPDGSKQHIARFERDDLLLSGLAEQVAPQRYRFTGEYLTLHSMADLEKVRLNPKRTYLRRFLEGSFIVELKEKRRHEHLETSECCAFEFARGRYQSRAIGEFEPEKAAN